MERSTELRDSVLAGFEAFSKGDASFVEREISRPEGVRVIGTDPNEWFEGGEQAVEALKQEVQHDAIDLEGVSLTDVAAFVEGTVGWASGRIKWILGNGREIPTRWTAVFHREDGEWKTVLAHTSAGVPNQELWFGG